MTKFVETIVIGLGTLVLSIFLPKQIVTLIREILKFIFNSLFRYWYLTISILGLVSLINYLSNFVYLGEYTSFKFILFTTLSISFIVTSFAIYRELLKKHKPFNIAFYGCFSVKENEYLTIDIDSENLNDKIEKICEVVSSTIFSYRTKFIKINNISLPKFIPILLGHKGFNEFIKKRIDSKKHLAAMHFIRDINKQNVVAIINYDKNTFKNAAPINTAEKLITNLSLDQDLNSIKTIELSVKIYLLMLGQSMTDFMLKNSQYGNVQCILDDTEKLISDIRNDAINISENHRKSVEEFLNFWTGYVERYKSVLLIEQKQFSGAILHIIKSIKLNPYFPYDSYSALKQDFTKKYGIDLTSTLNEVNKDTGTDNQQQLNNKVKEDLVPQVKYPDLTFNYEIMNQILFLDSSSETGELLISELNKLDKNNPFVLLSISEVIRYVKKGTEKFNQIYVDRFDASIDLLKETLILDSEFPVINLKLGTLMMMKGMHFNNDKLVEQGMKEYKKGMHVMKELGF